jgi:diguanylate cyclase (GGDEF)-like protein
LREAVVGDVRRRSAQPRRQSLRIRIRAAALRDAEAQARDVAATARDQLAALHDRELAAREAAGDRDVGLESRERTAADRDQAAGDRNRAAADRRHGAADLEVLISQLAIAETDALTGARTRAAGLADLEHEMERARRAPGPLVVAYVDVVGLKMVNDSRGHAAGDALLRRVVGTIRAHMRSYDLIVRLGGDEFLCAMVGATRREARERFRAVTTELAAGTEPCEIKLGFAALSPQDSADALIQRADAELPVTARSPQPSQLRRQAE